MSTLQDKAIAGTKWSAFAQFGRQGIQWITLAILARLLSPVDFGLVGMTMVVIGFLAVFKDLGTSAAIIQRKEIEKELLSSVFWVNALFGLIVTLFLYGTAPWVATFYQEPRIVPLIRVLSVTFLISGLSILHQALLQRDLAFRSIAKVELSATVMGAVTGIGAAVAGWGVWSLVLQSLMVSLTTTLLLWLVCRWKPLWVFRIKEIVSIAHYSLNLIGFSIVNYFIRNTDYLLIGRFLGAQALGYYTLAYRIMLYPLQNISRILGRVMFPTFSRIQERGDRFQRAYIRVNGFIAILTFPLMVGLFVVAEPFIMALLGEQWQSVILLVMLLAPVGMVQSIGSTVGPIYMAMGRTDWMFRWGAGAGIIYILAFVIGLRWGIIGVAAAYAIATGLLAYPSFAIPFRLIQLRVSKFVLSLWRPFMNSLIMAVVVYLGKFLLPADLSSQWQLGILVPLGIVVYALASWFLDRSQIIEIWNLVRPKA